jgi:ring-1,2-phenylacetyl-CoA epoxidase subunit PaaC
MAGTDADAAELALEELDDEEREAVRALLRTMADDEFVLAERYTEWQVRAPTLESDLAVSNIAQDELGHARLWYDLLEDFGATEADLIWEADPEAFRHSTLVELPFDVTGEGDWADAIVRGYLFDVYEDLLLESLQGSTYPRLRDRVGKVVREEEYHLEHARNWLERLCDDEPGRERVQDALDRLFPYALTLFAPTDHEATIVDLGVRTEPLAELRREWLRVVARFLDSLGLRVPVDDEGDVLVDVPERTGRRGDHTEHWPALFEAFTHTYRDMELTEPPRLLEDPDGV